MALGVGSQLGNCLVGRQEALGRGIAIATDADLQRGLRLDVAIPVGRPAPAGHDDAGARCRVIAHDFDDRLAEQARPAAAMDDEQQPVVERAAQPEPVEQDRHTECDSQPAGWSMLGERHW